MWMTFLWLALSVGAGNPAAGESALFEVRVFEAEPPPADAGEVSRSLGGADTFRLDRDLMALQAGRPPENLCGLGGLARGRILSSPRILAERNEEASVISGSNREGVPPDLDARVLWGESTEQGETVRVAVRVRGVPLGGEVRLRAGETWLFARVEGERLLAVAVTLRLPES